MVFWILQFVMYGKYETFYRSSHLSNKCIPLVWRSSCTKLTKNNITRQATEQNSDSKTHVVQVNTGQQKSLQQSRTPIQRHWCISKTSKETKANYKPVDGSSWMWSDVSIANFGVCSNKWKKHWGDQHCIDRQQYIHK